MDKEQAKRIIKDTFEASFDEGKFISFIMNLLNLKQSDIENTSFGIRQGYNIPEMFRPYISRFQRIAKYLKDDNRIDILIVYLKKESSVERARSRQRNFIAGYLKGNYGSDKPKDAALVAFISPNKADWRFSLVKMDYRFEEGKSGKIKVREEFTPVRRWSFLVGKNESSHTAQSRLVHILADDQYNPTLTQMEEAFNIEKVTKEFFLKYRNLFLRIKEGLDKVVEDDPKVKKDFAEKGVDTVNFTKKFLGQIVFLYFLQKKGWFGVERDGEWGTGPKDFLRQLFNKKYGNYKIFFNDILEPLFYEALARERDDNFYSRFNCKIPFLNSGLFEPIGGYDWVHTDINLSNELFSNRNDNYEGNGVLDIFDLFNFTVKEDEPLEKEVAIDPELLGKIYEKFNAIRLDNYEEYKKALKSGRKGEENKFNKKFGVYYTPREIVHYMCQESLINYLHAVINQELIKRPVREPRQIKLIGPQEPEQLGFHTEEGIVDKKAIEELIKYGEQFTENEVVALIKEQRIKHGKQKNSDYKLQLSETIRKNAKVIDEKLKAIRVCDPAVGSGAFPVGMMAEIVKARNVLSVYINEQNRTPYNFKRECIEKSLYGVDIDPGAVEIAKLRLWLSLIVDEEDIKNIKPLPNLDYKIMQGNSLIELLSTESLVSTIDHKRAELVKELKKAKDELFNSTIPTQKKNKRCEIDILMKELFEYDRDKQIKRLKDSILAIKSQKRLFEDDKDKKEDEKRTREIESRIEEIKNIDVPRPNEHFEWHVNYSEIFQEKGGFDVVIANPPYLEFDEVRLNDPNFLVYRDGFKMKYKFNLYSLFLKKGPTLLKLQGVMSYIVPNSFSKEKYNEDIRENYIKNIKIVSFVDFTQEKKSIFENASNDSYIVFIIEKTKLINQKIKIDKYDNKQFLFSHMINQKNLLKSFDYQFNISINSELIQKIKKDCVELGKICLIRVGLTPSKPYKNKYGKDYENFNVKYKSNKFLFKFLRRNKKDDTCDRWRIKHKTDYIIWDRELLYKDKVCPGEFEDYCNQKLIFRNRGNRILGSFDNKNIFVNDIFNVVVLKSDYKTERVLSFKKEDIKLASKFNLKYLLVIINSRVINFYLWNNFVFRDIKAPMMKKFPIKGISLEEQKPFIELVDCILAITKDNDYLENPAKEARVHDYERQLDQLVYNLYGLTEEEIKIVEKNK